MLAGGGRTVVRCAAPALRRAAHAGSRDARKVVAVLGGGITGLSAAFSLSQRLPPSAYRIVLIEAQRQLGGWMGSERVPVYDTPESPKALFEAGPRTIRPVGYKGLRTIEMVRSWLGYSSG